MSDIDRTVAMVCYDSKCFKEKPIAMNTFFNRKEVVTSAIPSTPLGKYLFVLL